MTAGHDGGDMFDELNPPARLLMGPGPANIHPLVLRAMSLPGLGQFDPEFTGYMNEVMALYRQVFETTNRQTFLVNGSARAGIEAAMVSVLASGDEVVILNFGRFGLLLTEIAERCQARVTRVEAPWGSVVPADAVAAAVARAKPRLVACVHGDTSTTMAQPLEDIGAICRDHGALLYVDATATLGGMAVPVDAWGADLVSAGLQKCLGGPAGSAPITLSDQAAAHIQQRRRVERGLLAPGAINGPGAPIGSNYFDLAMVMDYWSERRLNHHTEAGAMLYAARECARLTLQEGLAPRIARHRRAGAAMAAGLSALGLDLYGDSAHRMTHVVGVSTPPGIDYDRVRHRMRKDFQIEIGTAFGPLAGKVWRLGTMGVNARRDAVFATLAALEAILRQEGFGFPAGAGVDAALAVYDRDEASS